MVERASVQYRVLGIRCQPGSPFLKYLYLKPHRSAEQPADRALFVAGLAHNITSDHLRELFTVFGAVESVAVHPKCTSAIVQFGAAASLTNALKACAEGQIIEYPIHPPEKAFGVRSWLEQWKAERPGNAVLQRRLDEWVAEFEDEQERLKREAAEKEAVEGWTLVTRAKGRAKTKGNVFTGGVAQAAAQAAAESSKSKEHQDFYRFQKREKARSELLELRARFKEDRERMARLREVRKFKL